LASRAQARAAENRICSPEQATMQSAFTPTLSFLGYHTEEFKCKNFF
jgi:hypothetical protein